MSLWQLTDDGLWCLSCGTRVAAPDEAEPEECHACGFPDAEKVGQFHCDFDDDDDELCEFDAGEECGRWINGRLGQYCTLAGTEQCDWECPYS